MITFCTTCHKRLWQLKKTLPENLELLKHLDAELCILLYNDEEAYQYLLNQYKTEIENKKLIIINHKDDKEFSCGYAKSLSHQLGSGEILFNLDADNYIGLTYLDLLDMKPNDVLKTPVLEEGVSGRIGIYREFYNKTSGYIDYGRSDDGQFVLECLRNGGSLKVPKMPVKSPISNIQ